jgi:hypothetical protein
VFGSAASEVVVGAGDSVRSAAAAALARFFFADLDSVSAVGGLEMTGAAIVSGGGGEQMAGVVMHGIGGLRGRLLLQGEQWNETGDTERIFGLLGECAEVV